MEGALLAAEASLSKPAGTVISAVDANGDSVADWTIATPTAAFQAAITSPEIGQLARADEWDDALAGAVAGVRATQRHAAVAEANAALVRERYGWDRFGDRILEATLRDE